MKIVRHTAPDMRQALRSIREQLGEEAVILSSRRTGEGVEVTAAVDFDAGSLEAAAATTAAVVAPAPAPATTAAPVPPFDLQPEVHTEAMGRELQTLRRMLETQLAQLAWSERA